MTMHSHRAILSPDSRIIGARTPLGILQAFFPFAPLRVYAIFLLSVIALTSLLVVLLRDMVSNEAAWNWGVLGGLIGGGCLTMFIVVEWCHRLADCRFEVQNDILEIRAPTRTRILSASWPVSMIQEFVLESRPTLWEDFASERYYGASEILAGAERPEKILRIRTIDGGLSEFRMIDRVFTPRAVNSIVNELARRGVAIRRVTANTE
jgi:hypothetical protein